jgi:hypothetical protein
MSSVLSDNIFDQHLAEMKIQDKIEKAKNHDERVKVFKSYLEEHGYVVVKKEHLDNTELMIKDLNRRAQEAQSLIDLYHNTNLELSSKLSLKDALRASLDSVKPNVKAKVDLNEG